MSDLFASPEMAAGYARSRPAVHPHVIDLARARLGLTTPVGLALDVGCGAGLSTAPLAGLATLAIGIEPVETMVRGTPLAADGVRFAAGRAEAFPVRSGTVDLITAAGSLNYVDLDRFFAEAVRVLAPGGALVVYDFSAGRTFRGSGELDLWFTEFLERYPRAVGAARPLDPETLARVARDFRLVGSERFVIELDHTTDRYCRYVMTETNVANAIRNGEPFDAISSWCTASLADVFGPGPRTVCFPGYLAHLVPYD